MKTDPNVNVVENHLHVTLIKPFSPPILKSIIDPEIVDSLNKYCDQLIEEGGHDTSHRSISNNSGELNCDLSGFTDFGMDLYDMTKGLFGQFFMSVDANSIPELDDIKNVEVHDAWFVRNFKHDYIPAHFHMDCQYSCVLFLKVPECIGDKNSRNDKPKVTEGYIDFIYGSYNTLTASSFCCKPRVGDIYIFPSFLMHTVYPFFGEGERRSFAANLSLVGAI